MSDCRQIEILLAARAFDALEPAERDRVDAHLRGCEACQETYARLRELPVLLDLAGPAEVAIEAPPALLEASVLASLPGTARTPRRRLFWGPRPRRRALALAGLCLLLVLAALGLSGALDGGGRDEPGLAMTASPQGGAAEATVHLLPRPWGTQVDLEAKNLSPTRGPQIYEVWFVSSGGRVSAGTFRVGASGHVVVQLASAARAGRFESIGITREPDDTSPTRRGPNVLHADLTS